ncbi:MAG TPA: LuxR C-terminal-related transcriptional regulator [Anaerolineae bacterium]|nr:LuxR C-terminal-related transcriptional regulator [Anaerolineae bacterium]
MQKADTLIRTKLHLPFTRPGLVPRPRLQEQVAQGLCRPLTLITAPAGFGKTTLLASSIAGCGCRVAWLSLDKDDNQPERFLSYLVAALQEADPAVGSEAARLMAAVQRASPEAILTSLINDLATPGRQLALVLDDYQFIHSQAVHEGVAFLLEHCPTTFHLVIATRSDPPLPLARLRARGQMVELRAVDLGFTEPEAGQFLNGVMGLGLDAASVVALAGRTEGWIAGLQMAALSMRDRQDVAGFIASFSGTNRYILDYLLEEVLAVQPPEIRRFLLDTSILERLTAPLCTTLLGRPAAREPGHRQTIESDTAPESPLPDVQSILEYLERANLFLVPLDDERVWYRYHHLFADLLRAQLHRSLGVQGVAQLHARASVWHEQHASLLEAIHHASAASDDERVERLIEQNYMEMVRRGEMFGMRSWTGKLSQDLVYRRPWLCIYEAYSHSWFGELDEAERLLAAAEERIGSGVSASDAQAMLAQLTYVKSRVTAMRGDLDRAIELCLAAREMIPAGHLSLQFDSRVTLGYEYFLKGDYARAAQSLAETVRAGVTAGAIINTVAAACVLARLYAVEGQLLKSAGMYQGAAQLIPESSGEYRDARALVQVGLADLLYERNELDAALAHVEQGLALLPWWGKPDDSILAYLTLTRIQHARADEGGALEAVEKAIHLVQTGGVFPEAGRAAEAARVRLWLAQGDLHTADLWAASQAGCLDAGLRFENELAHLALVRVWLAQNRPHKAVALLPHLEEAARSAGRMGRVIEILLLQALAQHQVGDTEQALLALTECLALAEPQGYVRLFLDEGRPMQMLLALWLAHAGTSPLRGYAVRLLSYLVETNGSAAAFGQAAGHRVEPEVRPATGMPLEPLSQRELEVLHLISLGSTNREIARQLIVAPGTVKAHTASIYRKLDVANRTEAVARARQLGILP